APHDLLAVVRRHDDAEEGGGHAAASLTDAAVGSGPRKQSSLRGYKLAAACRCVYMVSPMETLAPEERTAAAPAPQPETLRLQPTRGFSRVLAPRELWRYRDLAGQIALRDITVRYRQTALGGAWAVLQPIGFMVVFSLIFGQVAGVSSNGLPYPLFSLAALVPWT